MDGLSVDSILAGLLEPRIAADIPRCRLLLTRVLQFSMTADTNLSIFLPPVVNLMAHGDLLIKKTAFNILSKSSDLRSDLLILAVNTLLKDVKDSNPTVRALALRTVCSVNHEAFLEHRIPCIVHGLTDSSPYVRRTAVLATVSVGKSDVASLKESGIINRLYELIRDQDPIVLVNCLLALEEILISEGGVVLNKKIVSYILGKLDSLTTWGVAYVTRLLVKYEPKSEEEVFDLMNILDPLFDRNSSSVCVNTLELFLHLIKNMPNLNEQVFQRCKKGILVVFTTGNSEMVWMLLQFLQPHFASISSLLAEHHKSLLCRLKDPVYVKILKLKLITNIIDMDNFTEILDEIVLHCLNKDFKVSLCAIKCLDKLLKEWPDLGDTLLKAFVKLLKCDQDHVVSNTLQVLVTMPVDTLKSVPAISEQLCVIARKMTDSDGISAALYLLGQLDNGSPEVLYVMESFNDIFGDLAIKVKGQLLLTGMQLLCRRPAEFQPVVGELMSLCLEESESELMEQVKFYYAMLHSDTKGTVEIFSNL